MSAVVSISGKYPTIGSKKDSENSFENLIKDMEKFLAANPLAVETVLSDLTSMLDNQNAPEINDSPKSGLRI